MKVTKTLLTAITSGKHVEITEDNFDAVLGAACVIATAFKDIVQCLVVFAVDHARTNDNDFTYLTKIMNQLVVEKYGDAIRTATLQSYLEYVVTGARWFEQTKQGDKQYKFAKRSKKAKISYNMKALAKPWYLFDNAGKAKAVKLSLKHKLELAMKQWLEAEADKSGKYELVDKADNDVLLVELNELLQSHS